MKHKNVHLPVVLGTLILLLLTSCGATGSQPSQLSSPAQSSSVLVVSSGTESSALEEALPVPTTEENPIVYMTTEINAESLMGIYAALGREMTGKVAVKISTGEQGSHFLDANLIKDLVQSVDGTIVECNTAYGGSRASTAYPDI